MCIGFSENIRKKMDTNCRWNVHETASSKVITVKSGYGLKVSVENVTS